MYGHGQRRPDEQLLVLGQAAAESLSSGDGLKGDLEKKHKGCLSFSRYGSKGRGRIFLLKRKSKASLIAFSQSSIAQSVSYLLPLWGPAE